ncbi:MAG: hypothetical protein M1433_01430 [Candidatus Parvarchaeota archaeon]|jgi:hypothetical protein|nr:hypothetical protein [Candidatus Parvarchaeota archaeon]
MAEGLYELSTFEERHLKCTAGIIGRKSLLDILSVSKELTQKILSAGTIYGIPQTRIDAHHSTCEVRFEGEYNLYSISSALESIASKYNSGFYMNVKQVDENEL